MRPNTLTFTSTLLLYGAAVAAIADDAWEDWNFNLRPENVTGLSYDLYPWVGSYYNGTINFQLEVMDWEDPDDRDYDEHRPCPAFLNSTIDFSYPSLLALTKPNPANDDLDNPLWLFAQAWTVGGNWTLPMNSPDAHFPSHGDMALSIKSIDGLNNDGGADDDYSYEVWTLSTTQLDESSYLLSGTWDPEFGSYWGLEFDHSTCNSTDPSLWRGIMLDTDIESDIGRLRVPTPRMTGRFNNQSASFEIEAAFRLFPRPGEDRFLQGLGTVSFVGRIDATRSDELLPARNDTPAWNATLGWSKDLERDISGGVRVGGDAVSVYLILAAGLGLFFLPVAL